MKHCNQMKYWWLACLAISMMIVMPFNANAEQAQHQETDSEETSSESNGEHAETPLDGTFNDDRVTTEHTATIGDKEIDYNATAGTLTLKDEDGNAKAKVFYIAYIKDGVDDTHDRPLTFSFNGGPGSSSVWLHLGTLGPRRVEMGDAGNLLNPPWRLVNNNHSILDLTDIVFIDPVTTGYSRAAEGEDAKQFHGVREDVESVGEFIRLWTTRHERWNSPKFLIGESYGTTRAAGLSGYLQDRHGMYLNGIMLVSSILDFQTARFSGINDLPYIVFLPTYTATAWYHRQLPDDLQRMKLRDVLTRAERFALNEYAHALLMGARLTQADRDAVVKQLARLTGLSETYVDRANLRISIGRFAKELLRDEGRTVGRLDSRFKGIDADHVNDRYEYDPSYAAIEGPYSTTLKQYVRATLGYESDLPYEILTGRVRPWNYNNYQNRYVTVSDTLREAMTKNQALRVFIASGYYDLATPYFATEHTVAHLRLDPSLRDHITLAYYEAGHMMYIHQPSLRKFKDDVARFFEMTLAEKAPSP